MLAISVDLIGGLRAVLPSHESYLFPKNFAVTRGHRVAIGRLHVLGKQKGKMEVQELVYRKIQILPNKFLNLCLLFWFLGGRDSATLCSPNLLSKFQVVNDIRWTANGLLSFDGDTRRAAP